MSTETDSFTSAPAIAGKDIPSLPIELHRRIFLLAPPRLSFGSFKERYELLCIASLVSNAWRKLALRELIRNPYLTRPKQESIFVKAACKVDSGFSKWGRKLTEKGKVESLWIGDCDGWREDMKVGSDFPCTVEVWMEGYSAEPVVIHPNEFRLSSSPSSATVHTNPVDEGQITRGWQQFALRTLAICDLSTPERLPNLAHATSLTRIFLLELPIIDEDEWYDLRNSIAPLLPQLVSLALDASAVKNAIDASEGQGSMFGRLQSIRHLDISLGKESAPQLLLSLLLSLPPSAKLISLRSRPSLNRGPTTYLSIVITAIRASPPALDNLRRLLIDSPGLSFGGPEARAAADAEREEIKAICREKGLEMLERKEISGDWAWGWEPVLNEICEEVAWTDDWIAAH